MYCAATGVFQSTGNGPPPAPQVLQASVSCLRRREHVCPGKWPLAKPAVQQQTALPPAHADQTLLEDYL